MYSGILVSKDTDDYSSHFGAYNRYNTYMPSVTCPNAERDEIQAQFGLLTADEVMLAGEGIYSYLYTGADYWTLSPSNYNEGALNFFVDVDGNLRDAYVGEIYGVRPVISLGHFLKAYNGDGSADNPFDVGIF